MFLGPYGEQFDIEWIWQMGDEYWGQICYGLGRQCLAYITVDFGIDVFGDPRFRYARNCKMPG
jgi:hypothetical protein